MSYCDKFDVITFDNLAIKNMGLKHKVDDKTWEYLYMGDEGQYTFYIDAVDKKFSTSSLSQERWDLMDNVDDMFQFVREKNYKHET